MALHLRAWLLVALLLALACGAHVPALDGPFFWDDFETIVQSSAVREGQSVARWFRPQSDPDRGPATMLSYRADWRLHGDNPVGFHATSLLLHALNAALLALLARRYGASIAAAGIASATWAVLPRLTEATAWLSGRSEMLAMAGLLAGLLLWPEGRSRQRRFTTPAAILAASGCLLFALLSSQVAIAGLVAIALGEGVRYRKDRRLDSPNVIALAACALSYVAFRGSIGGSGQATGAGPVRAAASLGTYFLMLVDPFRPNAQIGLSSHPSPLHLVIGICFGAALLGLGIHLFRRAQPRTIPPFAAAVLSLLLVAVVPRFTIAADRFLYVPTAFAAIALALTVSQSATRVQLLSAVLAAILCCAGAGLTFRRAALWREPLPFWVETCERADPHNPIPAGELGRTLQTDGFFAEAAALHKKELALLVVPRALKRRRAQADLAEALAAQGAYSAGRDLWLQALDEHPDFAFGWFRLGHVESKLDRWDEAIEHWKTAARLEPRERAFRLQLRVAQEARALASTAPGDAAAAMDEAVAVHRALVLTRLARTPEAEPLWAHLLETSRDPLVLKYALTFFAIDANPHRAPWALARLKAAFPHDETLHLTERMLQARVANAARVDALLPRIRACANR